MEEHQMALRLAMRLYNVCSTIGPVDLRLRAAEILVEVLDSEVKFANLHSAMKNS